MAYAVHHERVPPSGFSHGAVVQLTGAAADAWPTHRGRLLCHAVLARDDVLRIFEMRAGDGAREGGVVRAVQVRMHRLFGEVTGVCAARTLASRDDGRDRVLLAFRDAKLALMEWSDAYGDLQTVSIHTFERTAQLEHAAPAALVPCLRMDPAHRCGVLLLPHDAVAVLPLFQDTSELELADAEELATAAARAPYAPSFVLAFADDVDRGVKNVRDLAFLPGFQKPTLAVLYAPQLTWTGSLSRVRQTVRVSLVTLDLQVAHYPVTVTSEPLPYDCLYLTACPESLGGVLVVTPSALLHVDQTARVVGAATSAWFARTADLSLPHYGGAPLDLADSQLVFTSARAGLLFLADGAAVAFQCYVEGRIVVRISLEPVARPPGAPRCSFACALQDSHVLCASQLGASCVYAVGGERGGGERTGGCMTGEGEVTGGGELPGQGGHRGEGGRVAADAGLTGEGALAGHAGPPLDGAPLGEILDEDMDLYGESSAPPVATAATHAHSLHTDDTIPALGGLTGVAIGAVRGADGSIGSRTVVSCPHALAALEPRLRAREGAPIAPAQRMWTADLAAAGTARTLVFAAWDEECLVYALGGAGGDGARGDPGATADCNGAQGERAPGDIAPSDSALGNSAPDAPEDNAPCFVAQLTGRTLACAAAPDGCSVVRVTPHGAEVVGASGDVRAFFGQRGADENVHVVAAAVCTSYTVLCWSDGAVSVFHSTAHGWTPLRLQTPPATHHCHVALFHDVHGALTHDADAGRTWLLLGSRGRRLALVSLPEGLCVWTSADVGELPSRLNGASGAPEAQGGRGEGEGAGVVGDGGGRFPPAGRASAGAAPPAALEIAHVQLCSIGDLPTLLVQYENGQLAAFEARPMDDEGAAPCGFPLGFVRVDVCMLSGVAAGIDALTALGGRACAAVCGAHSVVVVRDATGPLQFLETEAPLQSIAALPRADAWTCVGVLAAAEACVLRWESFDGGGLVPCTHWRTGRSYTHVACHDETGCIVAASLQPIAFVLYKEEDAPVQDPAADPSVAQSAQGALELFTRVGDEAAHGYEFAAHERVTALRVAPLDCQDRASGRRAFVVVGTTTAGGEDRTARGHLYVFDVVETVPRAGDAPGDAMQLKCLCREEMRAPVTALSDVSGYLVAAAGQKLFVRSFEYMAWLVTIAFLDTAFYTTDIQRVKNMLLLTDVHRSASFVVFQENPARLVPLGRDYQCSTLTSGGLLIHREKLALVTADMAGCVRLMDYNPANPTSLGGQRLLVRTEFHAPGEVAQMLVLHGARDAASGECYSSEVLLAKRNGAVDVLVPVDDKVFQVLQLFQSQLVRSVRHTAGLNPRAFRAVPNVRYSRPLTKGMLDGTLLHTAECMSRPKLVHLVDDLRQRTGGVSPDDLLQCLEHLEPQW
ncbi:mRNA cleavage and polyadenylation factor subunit [Malassezia sp. CBS 17886]|nr:mRNA cleavage and polyadenylation factor subunit [Malassezia sp. CBS 17886]